MKHAHWAMIISLLISSLSFSSSVLADPHEKGNLDDPLDRPHLYVREIRYDASGRAITAKLPDGRQVYQASEIFVPQNVTIREQVISFVQRLNEKGFDIERSDPGVWLEDPDNHPGRFFFYSGDEADIQKLSKIKRIRIFEHVYPELKPLAEVSGDELQSVEDVHDLLTKLRGEKRISETAYYRIYWGPPAELMKGSSAMMIKDHLIDGFKGERAWFLGTANGANDATKLSIQEAVSHDQDVAQKIAGVWLEAPGLAEGRFVFFKYGDRLPDLSKLGSIRVYTSLRPKLELKLEYPPHDPKLKTAKTVNDLAAPLLIGDPTRSWTGSTQNGRPHLGFNYKVVVLKGDPHEMTLKLEAQTQRAIYTLPSSVVAALGSDPRAAILEGKLEAILPGHVWMHLPDIDDQFFRMVNLNHEVSQGSLRSSDLVIYQKMTPKPVMIGMISKEDAVFYEGSVKISSAIASCQNMMRTLNEKTSPKP